MKQPTTSNKIVTSNVFCYQMKISSFEGFFNALADRSISSLTSGVLTIMKETYIPKGLYFVGFSGH